MIHQLRPLNGIGFTTRKEAKKDGNKHLEMTSDEKFLVLVLEDFYADLRKAAQKYIRDVAAGRITTRRSDDHHVGIYK